MDGDAVLHPRGPLPVTTYWRRRATLLGLLVVLVLLLRSCGADGDGVSRLTTPTSSPTPTATQPVVPTKAPPTTPAPATSEAPQPCRDSDLAVEAKVNSRTFKPGERPMLTLVVTNTGVRPCTRDIGQAARELRVTTGGVRVWSSDDCSPGGAAEVRTLEPGAGRSFAITWSRKHSRPGCPAGQPSADPGTYRVVGRLGTLTRPGTTFVLEAAASPSPSPTATPRPSASQTPSPTASASPPR